MNDIVRIQGIKTAILFRYKFNGMPLLLGHVTLWGISQKTIFGPHPILSILYMVIIGHVTAAPGP